MPKGKSPFQFQPVRGRNSANSKAAPGAISRFLYSCGYEVVGQMHKVADGWQRAEVKDRKTGQARGHRWVRSRGEGVPGYEVRSTDPDPKVRALDARRVCPSCGGPLVVLAAGEDVPADVCSREVDGEMPGELCVTVARQIAEDLE